MIEHFYSIAEKLDRLKAVTGPTTDDISELTQYLAEPEYVRYFYHDLSNPSWVEPLYNLGWFYRIPPPHEDEQQPGYYGMPFWHEGEYLKRMADKFPNIVINVARNLSTENSRAIKTMLEALLLVPPNFTAQTTSEFARWITTPFANFMMLSHELGIIMEYLVQGGQIEAAKTVLKILLEPERVKDRYEDDKFIASSRHDYYWLNQALQLNLPALTKVDPNGVLIIAEEKLLKAIDLEHDPRIQDNIKIKYSYWRLSINPQPGIGYDNEIKDVLVNIISSVLDSMCEQKLSETRGFLVRYIDSEYSILRRISINTLRSWGHQYDDLLERVYKRYIEEPILGGQSEFKTFVELQFNNFSDTIKQEVVQQRKTVDPVRVNELMRDHPERFQGETPDEKRRAIVERWQLEELGPLAENLVGEDKSYYEYLHNKYGDYTPRPESGFEVTSWVGPKSPISTEELNAKTLDEVVQYLLGYIPPNADTFGTHSREGLGRTLESDVLARPTDYATNARLFARGDLPFVYHTHLFRGLEKAVKDQEQFALEAVISLCEFIVDKDMDNFEKEELEEGLSSTKLAITHLFEEVFRRKEPNIENELLNRSGQLIVRLLHQDEPFPDNEDAEGYDPATHSLNCVHGVALHSLISLGLYYERKRKKEMGEADAPGMNAFIKETLSEILGKTQNFGLAVHSVFGWYFPQFIYLDRDWAIINRRKIFPIDNDMAKYWAAAWNAYIRFSDVFTNVFPLILNQYKRAVIEIMPLKNKKSPDRADEKLATHILKAYLMDMIELNSEDGLLNSFYQNADDETRAHGNFWLSQVLGEQQPSANDIIWQKIWSLWQWRIVAATASKDPSNNMKEIANFCRLLKHTPLELPELFDTLHLTLEFDSKGAKGYEIQLIIEYLGENCEKHPTLAVSLLHDLVLSGRSFYLIAETEKSIEMIINSAILSDEETKNKVVDIINVFGERGDYKWRPFLDKIR